MEGCRSNTLGSRQNTCKLLSILYVEGYWLNHPAALSREQKNQRGKRMEDEGQESVEDGTCRREIARG